MSRRAERRKARVQALFPDDTRPAARPAVEPLRCPSCDAPVPLGDGDVLQCSFCNAAVPLPEAHRALRDAARARTADRAAAEAAYRRIGKPPSAILRAWARVATVVGVTLGGIAGVLLAIGGLASLALLFLLELVLHALAGPLGVDVVDRLGGGDAYALFALAVIVLVVLPVGVTTYLKGFVELRRTLQANLAARAPSRPGFPSTCRECGAALAVPTGALGVRCAYCHADNLVALAPAWVEAARATQRRFHGSVATALAKEAELRAEGRNDLKTLVIASLSVIPVAWVAGAIAVRIDNDMESMASFSSSMGPPRALVARQESDLFDIPSLPLDYTGVLDFIAPECERRSCTRHYSVALRKGETLRLSGRDLPSSFALFVRNTTTFPFLAWRREPPWRLGADGNYAASFSAPHTGLYLLSITMTGVHRYEKLHLGWTLGAGDDAPPVAPALAVEDCAPPAAPALDARVAGLRDAIGLHAVVATDPARAGVAASGGDDHDVTLWTVADRKVLAVLEDASPARSLAFSSDRKLLASASSDHEVSLWDVPDDPKRASFRDALWGHAATVTALAFLAGSTVLASGDADGTVRLWDAATGRERFALPATRPGAVRALAFTPDGKTLAATFDGGGRCWRAADRAAWSSVSRPSGRGSP